MYRRDNRPYKQSALVPWSKKAKSFSGAKRTTAVIGDAGKCVDRLHVHSRGLVSFANVSVIKTR